VSGLLDLDRAYRAMDDDGISVREELERIGYAGKGRIEASAYLELHVEQGPVLDREKNSDRPRPRNPGSPGGTDISAAKPIMRHDAAGVPQGRAAAASDLCCELRALALELGAGRSRRWADPRRPDVVNVIPSEAFFTIDFRQYDDDLFERASGRSRSWSGESPKSNAPVRAGAKGRGAGPFLPFMTQVVERAARGLDFSTIFMPSGAGTTRSSCTGSGRRR
jgi:N-carbamoyl-L-amino-acid hydrolase